MLNLTKYILFLGLISLGSSLDCTIRSFSQVSEVVNGCKNIIIDNLTVPGGQTLELNLQRGATVTFRGTTTFEVAHWDGPLLEFKGDNVVVQGEAGSKLNAQGEKYWDGHGGSGGVTKPRFVQISTTGGSVFKNIYVLNCALFCVGIRATDLTISGWTLDVKAGHTKGRNTDGFGISYGQNILIEQSKVMNQDDCIVVNGGSNMVFRNLNCDGSHGLSFSVGSNTNDNARYDPVRNITFSDTKVANGVIGIHIKTKKGFGQIADVTYRNIELSGLDRQGVYINQDYGDTGNIDRQFEISNLQLINVHGTVKKNAIPVDIVCNRNKCYNWNWSGVSLTGGKHNSCNFVPNGFHC